MLISLIWPADKRWRVDFFWVDEGRKLLGGSAVGNRKRIPVWDLVWYKASVKSISFTGASKITSLFVFCLFISFAYLGITSVGPLVFSTSCSFFCHRNVGYGNPIALQSSRMSLPSLTTVTINSSGLDHFTASETYDPPILDWNLLNFLLRINWRRSTSLPTALETSCSLVKKPWTVCPLIAQCLKTFFPALLSACRHFSISSVLKSVSVSV